MKRIIYIVFFITIVFNLNGCMYKSQTEISNQIWSGRWKCKEISMEIWSNDLDALNTNVEEYKNSMICGYVQFDNKTRNIYDIGIDDYFKEIVVYFDDGMTIEMGDNGYLECLQLSDNFAFKGIVNIYSDDMFTIENIEYNEEILDLEYDKLTFTKN